MHLHPLKISLHARERRGFGKPDSARQQACEWPYIRIKMLASGVCCVSVNSCCVVFSSHSNAEEEAAGGGGGKEWNCQETLSRNSWNILELYSGVNACDLFLVGVGLYPGIFYEWDTWNIHIWHMLCVRLGSGSVTVWHVSEKASKTFPSFDHRRRHFWFSSMCFWNNRHFTVEK